MNYVVVLPNVIYHPDNFSFVMSAFIYFHSSTLEISELGMHDTL